MTDLPLVVILLLTYQRTEYALRAIKATKENLIYPNLKWYVADAGSTKEDYSDLLDEVGFELLLGGHSETMTAGKNWNLGINAAFSHAEFYLRLEDDWALGEPFDISPFIKMLRLRSDIAMVRLGYLHVPADLEAIGIEGIHYLRYKKTTPFAYGGHPAIIQKSFHDAYGYNNEEMNPGQIEIDMDERFRSTDGPSIVRPDLIGPWGIYSHYGEVKGY